MNRADLATSTVLTPPVPADSGTSLVVQSGHGARFGTAPFYAIVHQDGVLPTLDSAEIILVTARSTDTFTITRAQKGTTAQSIATTWRISLPVLSEDVTPVGAVTPFAGTTEPTGWLLCYGQAVSRTTYKALFDLIGTTYGSGDGSTTFNLPDLRGRVVAGQDDMGGSSANRLTGLSGGVDGDVLAAAGGAEAHTLTTAEMPAHTHDYVRPLSTTDSDRGGASSEWSIDNTQTLSTASTGGGGAHNNIQPTLILNYIIKT